MKENWKTWFKAAGIRAIKTIAQTAMPTIKFPDGYFSGIVGNVKIPADKLPKLK